MAGQQRKKGWKMSGLRKQINHLLLFSILIGLLLPSIVLAEENDEKEKGQMEIKTDRITKYQDQINEVFRETELEKRFPTLFEEWTVDHIHLKQEESAQLINELKQYVLVEEVDGDPYVDDVKHTLFTEEYVVALPSQADNEQKSKSELISTSIIIASLIFCAMLLCIGIYVFIQKWNAP